MLSDSWRKSTYSMSNGQCVEMSRDGTVVLVRDTMDRLGPVLAFPAAAWTAFCRRLVQ